MRSIPLEKTIVNAIVAALKRAGFRFVIKTHGDGMQVAGIPDVLAIAANGRFVALEVKRPTVGRITPLQVRCLQHINRDGGYGVVVHSAEEALSAMDAAAFGEAAPEQG